jgi:uncharacterized protein
MPTPAFTRGDSFAAGGAGRAGSAALVLPAGLLGSLHEVLAAQCGPAADRVLRECGRDWGRAYAASFDRDLSDHSGAPLADWPFARFETCVASALAHHGWGRVAIDTSRFDQGVLAVTVQNPITAGPGGPPAAALLAGVLAGIFSAFTGRDLDAVPTAGPGDGVTIVLALAARVERVGGAAHGRPAFAEVLAELAAIRV